MSLEFQYHQQPEATGIPAQIYSSSVGPHRIGYPAYNEISMSGGEMPAAMNTEESRDKYPLPPVEYNFTPHQAEAAVASSSDLPDRPTAEPTTQSFEEFVAEVREFINHYNSLAQGLNLADSYDQTYAKKLSEMRAGKQQQLDEIIRALRQAGRGHEAHLKEAQGLMDWFDDVQSGGITPEYIAQGPIAISDLIRKGEISPSEGLQQVDIVYAGLMRDEIQNFLKQSGLIAELDKRASVPKGETPDALPPTNEQTLYDRAHALGLIQFSDLRAGQIHMALLTGILDERLPISGKWGATVSTETGTEFDHRAAQVYTEHDTARNAIGLQLVLADIAQDDFELGRQMMQACAARKYKEFVHLADHPGWQTMQLRLRQIMDNREGLSDYYKNVTLGNQYVDVGRYEGVIHTWGTVLSKVSSAVQLIEMMNTDRKATQESSKDQGEAGAEAAVPKKKD